MRPLTYPEVLTMLERAEAKMASKASEWAKTEKPARPTFSDGIAQKVYVDDDGRLFTMAIFEPSQALALARWILATFGEETP